MTPRLIGAARGDPYDPRSVSGVPRHLFDALERRYPLAARIDARLPRWQALLVALASMHPSRARWQERFFKSPLAFQLQSRRSAAQIARAGQPFDLVLQVYGLFRTTDAPFVLYQDTTHRQTLRHWPAWSPLGARELARWLAYERELYHAALHVFAVGQATARSLIDEYDLPPERVSVVGGGYNFARLPKLGTPRREPIILFVGREFRRKGGDCLLEAFRALRRRVPGARLVIVGTTEPAEEPGVFVLGDVRDREEIARLYERAQVFCLPSRFDPYPGVIAEAMAYALPVVSTDVCAIPEIVLHEQTGLLVPPGDSTALAVALARLLERPTEAVRLGEAGRRRVERDLSWDHVVERMVPVLNRLGGLTTARDMNDQPAGNAGVELEHMR
jgi:glycosyltransferase involved in cell wall biosynthesis